MFPTSSFLQIPPRDGHPCFRLYPSHYRADSGLAPVRNVRRRAHCKSRQDRPAGLYLHIFRHFGENALLLFFTAAGLPIGKSGIRSGHGFRPRSGLRPGNGFRPYISTGTGRSYRTLRTGSSTAAAVALAAEGIIVLAAAGIVILASVLMSSAASAIVVLAAGIT